MAHEIIVRQLPEFVASHVLDLRQLTAAVRVVFETFTPQMLEWQRVTNSICTYHIPNFPNAKFISKYQFLPPQRSAHSARTSRKIVTPSPNFSKTYYRRLVVMELH